MHFGGLEDCRKDYTSPHITSGPQLGGYRHWGLAICTFHLGFSLVLTDMEPDAEIEALAAARSVAVHWGSTDNLVELAAERKVYVRPTSAGDFTGFSPIPAGGGPPEKLLEGPLRPFWRPLRAFRRRLRPTHR